MLVIDTSLCGVGLAVADGDSGELLGSYLCPAQRAAERELAHQARVFLGEFGKPDKVVVAMGPGSFTGIRIGIAFAKGLAMGLDGAQLCGVSSLQVLASALAERQSLVVFLRITANYGIIAMTQHDGSKTELQGAELKSCVAMGIASDCEQFVIAGSWSELAAQFERYGVAYRQIENEQLLESALTTMARTTVAWTMLGRGADYAGVTDKVQPLYIRQPYVSDNHMSVHNG